MKHFILMISAALLLAFVANSNSAVADFPSQDEVIRVTEKSFSLRLQKTVEVVITDQHENVYDMELRVYSRESSAYSQDQLCTGTATVLPSGDLDIVLTKCSRMSGQAHT